MLLGLCATQVFVVKPLSRVLRSPGLPHLLLIGLVAAATTVAEASSLSAQERSRAAALSQASPWRLPRSTTPGVLSNGLGVQTVSVEWHERKTTPHARLARVLQYDHGSRQSRRLIVDVDGNTVIDVLDLPTRHLPLSADEQAWARSRLDRDTTALALINTQRQALGKPQLTDLHSLDVKASIFADTTGRHGCQLARCALVSLFDDEQRVYTTDVIVRFDDGAVVLVDGL